MLFPHLGQPAQCISFCMVSEKIAFLKLKILSQSNMVLIHITVVQYRFCEIAVFPLFLKSRHSMSRFLNSWMVAELVLHLMRSRPSGARMRLQTSEDDIPLHSSEDETALHSLEDDTPLYSSQNDIALQSSEDDTPLHSWEDETSPTHSSEDDTPLHCSEDDTPLSLFRERHFTFTFFRGQLSTSFFRGRHSTFPENDIPPHSAVNDIGVIKIGPGTSWSRHSLSICDQLFPSQAQGSAGMAQRTTSQ